MPVPPNAKLELEADFDIIAAEDCVPGTDDEVYEKLLDDLKKQIQVGLRLNLYNLSLNLFFLNHIFVL